MVERFCRLDCARNSENPKSQNSVLAPYFAYCFTLKNTVKSLLQGQNAAKSGIFLSKCFPRSRHGFLSARQPMPDRRRRLLNFFFQKRQTKLAVLLIYTTTGFQNGHISKSGRQLGSTGWELEVGSMEGGFRQKKFRRYPPRSFPFKNTGQKLSGGRFG